MGLAFILDDSENRELSYSRYPHIPQRMFSAIRYSYIVRVVGTQFLYCLTILELSKTITPQLALKIIPVAEQILPSAQENSL